MTAISQNRRGLLLTSLVTLVTLSGCTLPDAHLPRGFSSSYYRALQSTQSMPTTTTADIGVNGTEVVPDNRSLRVWNPLRPPGQ